MTTTLHSAIRVRVRKHDHGGFGVEDSAYAEFLTRLDAPPAPNDRLLRTLRTPAPLYPLTLMITLADLRRGLPDTGL